MTSGGEASAAPGIAAVEPAWAERVLRFWFQELSPLQWWRKDPVLDEEIRARFGSLHDALVARGDADFASPRIALAAVVVLDQFSRNMFRGDPRAFVADALARRVTTSAIDAGWDVDMTPEERQFLYMPLQHSEDIDDQQRALQLVAALGNPEWTRFAVAHKRIIERFGRFPHRNAVLGRASSPEELASLKDPMGAF